MAFTKKVPEWNAVGTEPPASLKESGFTPGYKPPAEYFNWFWHGTSEALKELQNASSSSALLNLLDNSDFTNPVNRNGATSYTGSKEGIDKWVSRSGYCTVTVNEDCVNIKSTNGTTTAYVLQFVEPAKIKSGKKYTAGCQLKDGSIHTVTAEAVVGMAEETRYIYVNEEQLGTIRLRYDTSEEMYAVMFSTLSTSGMDIVNVALYEGEYTADTLPIYQPKGYSLEAVICGGGGGLNFNVVGGTTQPTNPSENTIWVNTSTAITSYVFSQTQPETPEEGMVWITVGANCPVPFSATKKNPIMVYPLNAKQYISGAWTDKDLLIYQDSKWSSILRYLYYYGDQKTAYTGGWMTEARPMYRSSSGSGVAAKSPTVTTQSNGGVKLTVSYSSGVYRTTNKIDLTNVTTITLNGQIYGNNSGNANWAGMYVWSTLGSLYVDNVKASVTSKQTTVANPTLNVSSLSGEYYIGFGLYDTAAASHVIMNSLILK